MTSPSPSRCPLLCQARRRAVAMCLPLLLPVLTPAATPAPPTTTGPVRYALLTVAVRNTGPTPVEDGTLRVGVPVTCEYQQVLGVTHEPFPAEFELVPGGGKVAYYALPVLPSGHTAWFLLLAKVRLLPWVPRETRHPRLVPPSTLERCLEPTGKVDPKAPAIADLALRLRAPDHDPADTVRRINHHLATTFTYRLDGEQTDAAAVLAARAGSCSELSRLFIALARACDVPARFAIGSRLRTDVNGYVDCLHHRWVEVHLPRVGWFPIDISMNVDKADPETRYGNLPAQYLAYLRNPGAQQDSRFAATLALVDRPQTLAATARTYWFGDSGSVLWEALRRPGGPPAVLSRGPHRLDGALAVPLLAMALTEPLAAGDPGPAIQALAASTSPSAVVPLIDVAGAAPPERLPAVLAALTRLTGLSLPTPAAWVEWRRGDGLAFLRQPGPLRPAQPPPVSPP